MPFTLYSSQIKDKDAFAADVAAYVKLMIAHQLDKTGKPRPTTHPWIEMSVKRVIQGNKRPDTFVPDYVIENDDRTEDTQS